MRESVASTWLTALTRNFLRHASSSKPKQVLKEFSDDRDIVAIMFAVHGPQLLRIQTPETDTFTRWLV
jgi:hypothetical protein